MSPLHLWSYALFNLVFLHWFSGQVNLCASPLRAGFLFYFKSSFPGHISRWFAKPGVLEAHLSCAGSRGWGAWCAQIPRSSGKGFVPLWSLPIVDCWSWGVVFISSPVLCILLLSFYFTLCCGGSVHSVFKSLSGGTVPYVVVHLLCL